MPFQFALWPETSRELFYEQPDVFPQPSHTKHAPDIRIFTPHVIHRGASDLIPIDSSRSDDDPIV